MTRSRTLAALALMCTALAIAACGGDDDTSSQSSGGEAAGGAGKTIKLLYSAPLTSDPTGSGQAGCDGATLAAGDVNAGGGIAAGPLKGAQLSIECVDDEYSTDVVATLANRYISDPDIWTMMGFLTTGQAEAASKVVTPSGLSIVASNVSGDSLTSGADNVLVLPTRLPPIAAAEVDFCKAYYGATRIANIDPDFSYIDELKSGAKPEIEKQGMQLVSEQRYKFGTKEFAPYLTAVKGKQPQCIFNGDFSPVPAQLISQARKLGITAPFLDFCACGTAQASIDVAKDDYVGFIIGEALPFERPEGSLLAKVSDQWEAKHATRLTSYPAWSYDSVLVIAKGIADGATKREDLLEKMAAVDIEGVTGPLKFNADLRPESATLTLLEQTGPGLDDVEPVASYKLNVDDTFERQSIESCDQRPSCTKAG